MGDDVMPRPELVTLEPVARQRVLDQIAAKGGSCGSCGGTDFDVGAVLYLGFLFLDEDDDAYMVALTCRSRGCAKRTGVVLAENEFLSDSRARVAV